MNVNKRKIILISFAVVWAIMLSCLSFISCGNQAILNPGNFTYTHVHAIDSNESACFDLAKWWDNDGTGIEVKLENGNGLFFSEGSYILFESKSDCPFCK